MAVRDQLTGIGLEPCARWAGRTRCPYCFKVHDRPACHDLGGDDFALVCPRTGWLYGIDGEPVGHPAPEVPVRTWQGRSGQLYFVSDGVSRGTAWAVYTRRPTGSLRRVKSPRLPVCATRGEAQQLLDRWARERGLKEAIWVGPAV